ncbi:hypothetical protein HBH89_254420 [Parastagonospora nodorum]|nr:hypothetical protein HBH89_254420 [Parastagonospora nodorum]
MALSVDLPFGKSSLHSRVENLVEAKEGLRVVLRALKPVLTSPWSVLMLSIGRHAQLAEFIMHDVDVLFHRIFSDLHPGTSLCRTLRYIDRLVLNYGHSRSPAYASTSIFGTLSDTSNRLGICFKASFSRELTNAWVSKLPPGKDEGWRLTMDFKQGMGAVEGASAEIPRPGGIRIRTP